MDKRTSFIKSLIGMNKPISEIKKDIAILTKNDLINVMNFYINNKITASDFMEWANLIEGREDIDYETEYKDEINNIVYQIANPDINGEITVSLI
jgi:hypothetical protein